MPVVSSSELSQRRQEILDGREEFATIGRATNDEPLVTEDITEDLRRV